MGRLGMKRARKAWNVDPFSPSRFRLAGYRRASFAPTMGEFLKSVPLLIHCVITTPGPESTANVMDELRLEPLGRNVPVKAFRACSLAVASAAIICDLD